MSDDSGPFVSGPLERAFALAALVLVWAVVICVVLSLSRCTYDYVSGKKVVAEESSAGNVFSPFK